MIEFLDSTIFMAAEFSKAVNCSILVHRSSSSGDCMNLL